MKKGKHITTKDIDYSGAEFLKEKLKSEAEKRIQRIESQLKEKDNKIEQQQATINRLQKKLDNLPAIIQSEITKKDLENDPDFQRYKKIDLPQFNK